jgi:hypothetical protein
MPTPPTFFARQDGVFAEDIVDEVLIYDTRADMGHALSKTAAVVWRTCEGGATLDEIAEQLIARDLADSSDAAAELADTAVAELIEKRLLDTSGIEASAGVSRRQAMRRMAGIGGAAILGPLIVSAAVPTAAFALSCHSTGGTCGSSTSHSCCTGYVCSSLTSGTCAACPTTGNPCTSDTACCSSDVCGGTGTCVTSCKTSGSCTSDIQCCFGLTCSFHAGSVMCH